MKRIDITTPQNVTVEYNLASVWERAAAFCFDLVILVAGAWILWLLTIAVFSSAVSLAPYFTVIPVVVLYALAFEQLNNGQSPGKMIIKIRVIRMDGERTHFLDYFMRWMFRAIDIYLTLGGAAILSISSSRYNQRIGDLLANTVVVSVGKDERIKLHNILKLNKIDNYKVTYPQVAKMPEESMIVVKETLARHHTHENEAHEKALNLLADKMAKGLGIKPAEGKRKFLKTLLQDYIILTR